MEKERIIGFLNQTVRVNGLNEPYMLQRYVAYRDLKSGKLEHCVQLCEKNNAGNVVQVGIEQVNETKSEWVYALPCEEPEEETGEQQAFIIKHFNRAVHVEALDGLYVLKQYSVSKNIETGRLERRVRLTEKNNPFHAIEVGIERVIE